MQTHSEVSAHPRSGAVTVASSGKEMEADVQRKMKLWGVIEGFRDGRLPDNEQIFSALEYAHGHSPVPLDKLSPEGRELVEDLRDIIKTMGDIVEQKNGDELIQETIYNSYHIDLSHAQQQGVNPTNKQEALADREQAGKHLRVLASLFLTNGEVRKLVKDFGIVGRDMFAQGAARAAEAARPSDQQLNQVDAPAPDKTWVGPDGQTLGPNDSPQLQMKAADGSQIRYDPKDDPRNAQIIGKDGNTTRAGDAYNQYQDTKQEAMSRAGQAGQAAMQGVQGARQQGGGLQQAFAQGAEHAAQSQGTSTQQGQGQNPLMQNVQHHAGAVNAHRDPNAPITTQARQVFDGATQHASNDPQAQNVRDNAQQRLNAAVDKIPEEHRQRIQSGANQVEQIVRDEFPKERRDQFIYRLKKVLVEVQQHKDYFDAMDWLLSSAEKYKGYGVHVAQKGNEARQQAASDDHATGTLSNFLVILERFANGQSLQPVRNALDQIYTDARNDQQLDAWWKAINDYVHAVLLEPGYVMEDECNEHGRALVNNGRQFFEGRYKPHWDNLWNELTAWLKAFNADPLNRAFGEDWKRLTKNLLFNDEGSLAFKPKLWRDIRRVILPSLIRNIGYVPIPRAEYTDETLDLVVENLILSGPNLFPNIVSLENHNFFQFSPSDKIKDKNHNRFRLSMTQIQCDIRDVRFAFRKKKGFPRLKDSGIADVVVARNGISIDVELETLEGRRDTVFVVRKVSTEIDELFFKLRDTKHDLLYKFIKGPATGVIKKALAKAVEASIRTGLEYVDDQLVEIRNTIDESKDQDDVTRKEALQNLYKRKKSEAQEAKAKAEAHKPKGEFRIVMDRDQSLLPNMSQDPSKSIVQRLWKTQDAAKSGRSWHSPAFSITSSAHPATSGRHHPDATRGAATGTGMTAGIAQAAHNKKEEMSERSDRATQHGRQAERVADHVANQPTSHQQYGQGVAHGQGQFSGQQGMAGHAQQYPQPGQGVTGQQGQHGGLAQQAQQALGGHPGQPQPGQHQRQY
ncbi:hypothetical protein CC85DRAFT_286608 [Cutaneotrichosporon oleaginosum]|uniref:Uncharacterized protein n=2 Tax=Cutaneotrichosporon oleaginosum TaxID=879819 RepID=A0A0J0XJL8_9TREE|nr:uncharacterized protein CC85DRAFT_286608 [Cutaneotrichosporon oleaginosum]KLT41292.1 hypothetical protein CC85DRAFT_286608 [Cutaneotrichosporon oleaginosum]